MRFAVVFSCLVSLLSQPASAQEQTDWGPGTLGISFDLAALATAGETPTMGLTYVLSQDAAVIATVALESNVGVFGLGGAYRNYLNRGDVRGFWQAGGGIAGDGTDDVILGATGALGAEYWLNSHVSVWGMTGISVIVEDDFNAVTGTSALHASLYF
jgi:hypothetical protein